YSRPVPKVHQRAIPVKRGGEITQVRTELTLGPESADVHFQRFQGWIGGGNDLEPVPQAHHVNAGNGVSRSDSRRAIGPGVAIEIVRVGISRPIARDRIIVDL